MYADNMTDSMQRAIDETNRRREIQVAHNEAHGIVPSTIIKEIRSITHGLRAAQAGDGQHGGTGHAPGRGGAVIQELEEQMRAAAKGLEFEKAALLRDEILELREAVLADDDRPEWEKYRQVGKQRAPKGATSR